MTEPRRCPSCDSTDLSITPVPGLWIQYWCNDCEHWWWERSASEEEADTPTPPPSP